VETSLDVEDGAMVLTCSKCGKEFKPGTSGWMARLVASGPGILPESPLTKTLLCPEHYAELGGQQKAAWHEYVDPPHTGPAREKRPGHLKA
jgi:hypothetical protein